MPVIPHQYLDIYVHAAREGWLIATPQLTAAGWGSTSDEPDDQQPIGFASIEFDGKPKVVYPQCAVLISPDGMRLFGHHSTLDPSAVEELPELTMTDDHVDNFAVSVQRAVQLIEEGKLEKVVLARPFDATATQSIDPAAIALALLANEPTATIYSFPTANGGRMVGASPELLLEQNGRSISMQPLAGTAPRGHEDQLLASSKDRHEHTVMVANLVERLAAHEISVDVGPLAFRKLASVVHLSTRISGELPATIIDPLEVAGLVQPTAAVAGIPLALAITAIRDLEVSVRGLYAGAIGYISGPAQAQWWVAIRGVEIHGANLRFWAGAGIVHGSTPESEIQETELKFRSVAKIFAFITSARGQ
jgi:isochorismate synthase